MENSQNNDMYEEQEPNCVALAELFEKMIYQDSFVFFEEDYLVDLVDYYEDCGKIKHLEQVIDYGLQHYPFSCYFCVKKAQSVYENTENFELTYQWLDKALLLEPNNIDALLLRCDILCFDEKHYIAISLIEERLLENENVEELIDLYLQLSDIYEDMNDFEKVYIQLCKAVTIDPNNVEALDKLWFSVEISQNYAQSIDFHKIMIDEFPNSFLLWNNLGNGYKGLKQYNKAIFTLKIALALNETFFPAYIDIAECYFALKKYEKALEYYILFEELVPETSDNLYTLGLCHEKLKQYRKALQYYRKSVFYDPNFKLSFYRIGLICHHLGKYKNALSALYRTIRLDNENTLFYLAIGDVHLSMEEYASAQIMYKLAIDMRPKNKKAWQKLAKCYFLQQDFYEVEEICQKAKTLLPKHKLFDIIRIAALIKLGSIKEATDVIMPYLPIKRLSKEMLFSLITVEELPDNIIQLIA